jgi:prolyl-tRNA editing enzyme YbaK/EbsC (Cys-tRNA(Pro) deacylase)
MKKTNASRILNKMKIPHEILEYEVDEQDLSAENAAKKMGQSLSPLGMKKNYPTYIDESAFQFPFIIFSAGLRGLQLKINSHDLLKASN